MHDATGAAGEDDDGEDEDDVWGAIAGISTRSTAAGDVDGWTDSGDSGEVDDERVEDDRPSATVHAGGGVDEDEVSVIMSVALVVGGVDVILARWNDAMSSSFSFCLSR
jgi:hypothetical protein